MVDISSKPAKRGPSRVVASSPLQMTSRAAEMIRQTIDRDRLRGQFLRVSIVSAGCEATRYELRFAAAAGADDLGFDAGGISLVVARETEPFLRGVVLDYVVGLYGGAFRFHARS